MEAIATNGSTAVAKKVTPFSSLRDLLEQSRSKLAQVTPKHLTADRMVRIALAASTRNPAILQCTPTSVLQAVMLAAQLGLEPGGALGGAYLVPYKDQCTLIVGYRGLIDLARRSGQILSIEAHVVHEKDKFVCKYGLNPVLEHEPDWSENPGSMRAVYAVAKLKDGGTQCEVMTLAQIEAIRNRSRAGKSGPWQTDYAEMARKTVVRRLCKYLPLSVEMAQALETEDRIEDSADVLDLDAEAQPSKTEKVKNKVLAQLASAEPANEEPPHDAETGEVFEGPEPGSNG